MLGIFDPRFESIVDGQSYALSLHFARKGRLDDAWGVVKALGVAVDGGNRGVRLVLDGRDFIADFARSDTIALFRDDRLVVSLSLKGSAKAAARLRDCANMVERLRPSDPFAD